MNFDVNGGVSKRDYFTCKSEKNLSEEKEMRHSTMILTVLLALLLACGTAFAASSKVTADCSDVILVEATDATQSWDLVLFNELHTANWADLNVDVSLECGLYTDTLVKSKGGKQESSTAEAGVEVRVIVDGEFVEQNGTVVYVEGTGREAIPGNVTFCRRSQTLIAVFQGLLTNAVGDVCLSANPLTGAITIDEDCLRPEELELILDTMNANSFNFIIPDVTSGTHSVAVIAQIDTNTDVSAGSGGTAEALAAIGKGTVTVDEVRYIKRQTY
jgi:hypothetical protein